MVTQPVSLQVQPAFHPFVCIRCGCGTGQRKYFIDLGLNLDNAFNPMYDGNVYYCDECIANTISDVNRLVEEYEKQRTPVDITKEVATYEWEEKIEVNNVGRRADSTGSIEEPSIGESNSSELFDRVEPDVRVSEGASPIPEPAYSGASQSRESIRLDFGV